MLNDENIKVDLTFRLSGNCISLDHGYLLYSALSTALDVSDDSWLHTTDTIGLHLIRGQYKGPDRLKLTEHSCLAVRLPVTLIPRCLRLAGQRLQLGRDHVQVGNGVNRHLVPASTLYARIVTTCNGQDEARFDAEIQRQVEALDIHGRTLRGQRRCFSIKQRRVIGHSLLVTDLTAEESIRLQEQGLGGRRKMGCGLFLPWKG